VEVLVLGGTHHVGRCLVEEARRRGHGVTVLNRGTQRPADPGVHVLVADRRQPDQLSAALERAVQPGWDVVIDTWSAEPLRVWESAAALAGRSRMYHYVSSRSVYRWPIPVGADERWPVVDADPSAPDAEDYAAAKRGAELAVEVHFGDRHLVARAGLILGPYERVGRLPWWLRRIQRGGRVLAPGPQDRPLQYVDGLGLPRFDGHPPSGG
jgi:2'-hydroxyisoflavone reductase